MSEFTKSRYKKLNYNLKNIIFIHLPIIQIQNQITKIDKSTLAGLKKNPVNFIKNNYEKLKNLTFRFNIKTNDKIHKIKELCSSDYNLKQNNIDEIIVFLLIINFSSLMN